MAVKKDDEETNEPVPDNQSPDTGDPPDDDEHGDDDELDSRIEGVVGRVLDKLGIKATGERSNGGEAPPGGTGKAADGGTEGGGKTPDPPTEKETPTPPPASSQQDIDAAVKRALEERDHKTSHEKLSEPPEPKPPRKGLARTIFGP